MSAIPKMPLSELTLIDIERCISDGIWDWHIQADPPYEYYSPSWKRMMGYADSELRNTPETWQRLIHPEDLQRGLDSYIEHRDTGSPYILPVRYKHKQGHWVHVICRGQIIERDHNGDPVRMVGSHQDITDLMRVRDQLDVAVNALRESTSFKNRHGVIDKLVWGGVGILIGHVVTAVL